jgi:hypothetical protein
MKTVRIQCFSLTFKRSETFDQGSWETDTVLEIEGSLNKILELNCWD